MSLKLGTTTIAGVSQNTKYNAHSLFDFKWADHKLNEISWLEASTFSWQSGDVYVTAYNHLVQDIQGITAETETIGSYTITFYRATDGHKVCLANQEQTVLNIYNTYGIAWYYILDTTNTQFKLPRTKFGFEGLRTNVGDKIDESLPNITGSLGRQNVANETLTGCFSKTGPVSAGTYGGGANYLQETVFNASSSSSTYQNNAPVQERATQMYLYFYVGDYTQTAIEQTAGLNSELFNGKADLNLANVNNQAKILMSGTAMPSNTFQSLTLGASDTAYTAPANGYVYFGLGAGGLSYYGIYSGKINIGSVAQSSGYGLSMYLPVNKGETFYVSYQLTPQSYDLRFIYANGSESEAQ